MLSAADVFCRCIGGTSATSAGTNVRNDEGWPSLGGGFGRVGGGVRLVLFSGLLSLVCLSVVLGEAFATGVRGCAFLVGWRGFELGSLMRQGTPPRVGGFRCASGVSARFWAQVRPGGAGLGPGSPVARWWRGSGVRPSRDHDGRVPGGRSDLALLRCHVTKGRHALHA